MTYRVCYEAKRKNAVRHVVTNIQGRPQIFKTIEEAQKNYMFRNENYNVYVVAVTKEGWRRV